MKLFKNVGLPELKEILKNGILPVSITGKDNWEEGKRSPNSKEVVYLFEPKTKLNTFMQYGLVLLEVQTKYAKKTEFMANDHNNEFYNEYVKNEIKPEEIKSIYIPKILRKQIEKTNFLKGIENRITWVELEDLPEKSDIIEYENTANIEYSFNYLRGFKNLRKEKRFFGNDFCEVEVYDCVIEMCNQNTIIF